MTIEIKVPEISEGVESVDIAEILVKVGDTIEAEQAICEVETDKAVAEIPSPQAGKVAEIHVGTGDTVNIGAALISLEPANGAATAPESEPATPVPAPAPPPEAAPAPSVGTAAPGSSGPIEFVLPEIAEGVESVDVAEVLINVGDSIDADTNVIEVETDKAVAEVPCPHAGKVTKIHVKPGDTLAVGGPVLTMEATGAAAPASQPASPAPAAKSPAAVPSSSPPPPKPSAPARPQAADRDGSPPPPAGPATRRMARKLGVDLHLVKGTGSHGRILPEDVEGFVRSKLEQAATGGGGFATPELPDFSKFGATHSERMNKIARTSAENLSVAWNTIPHVTQHDLADVTELELARKRYVKSNPNKPKITMTAIMIKAVVSALRQHPQFNASIDSDAGEIIYKDYYHIGVAVDTDNGLVVPVIRDCDQKNVLEIAAELIDLAKRARDRKLKIEEMQGASFTITNLGGIGGTSFTPIVNWPEVAILGMSRGRKELSLEDGELVERLMLPLSLSYDHRIINGADAARFIVRLSGSLSNFFELF